MGKEITTDAGATTTPGPKAEGTNMSAADLSTLFSSARKGKDDKAAAANTETGQGEPPADGAANRKPQDPKTDPGTDPEPEPEPEPETDPEGEGATDAEGDEKDPTDEPADEPSGPKDLDEVLAALKAIEGGEKFPNVLKRIHRLAEEKNNEKRLNAELMEQNKQLQGQLQEAGKVRKMEPGNYANHPEMAEITEELGGIEAALSWLEQNPEGGEVTDAGGRKQMVSPEHARAQKRTLEDRRTKLISKQGTLEANLEAELKQQRQKEVAAAQEKHPWLKNQKSPEFAEALRIYQGTPGIEHVPGFVMLIADAVAFRHRKAASAAPAALPSRKANPAKEPTPQPGKPNAAAPRQDGVEKDLKSRQEGFEKSGRAADLGSVFAAKRRSARETR